MSTKTIKMSKNVERKQTSKIFVIFLTINIDIKKHNDKMTAKNKLSKVVEVMINYLLLALLFVISFLFAQNFIIHLEAERYKKKNIRRSKTNENLFKHFISKYNFIRTKENFLSKQGYPLNLNIVSYFSLKLVLAMLFFVAGLLNYKSWLFAIVFALIGYFFIDVYIAIRKKSRDSEICADLMNVTRSIYLQVSAGVSLKNAFKGQYENCKNKDFKKAILEFATKYELSELNITESTKILKDKFDILEVEMFCRALETYNETTQIDEVLENITQMLKKKNIEKVKQDTITKIIYITTGVIIALGNIILITFYPLLTSIGQGFNNVFK